MFSFPENLGGLDRELDDLVRWYGGRQRVCADFHIAEELLDAYLRYEIHPPYTLLLAIYWQGPFGFDHGFVESHPVHKHNIVMRRIAEERAAKLLTMVDRIVQKLGPEHKVSALLTTAKDRALSGAPLWHDRRELVAASRATQELPPYGPDPSPRNSGLEETSAVVARLPSAADAQEE